MGDKSIGWLRISDMLTDELCEHHRTFSWVDHWLDHESSLNTFKKLEIMICVFSEHNSMKIEISDKKKLENSHYVETEGRNESENNQ